MIFALWFSGIERMLARQHSSGEAENYFRRGFDGRGKWCSESEADINHRLNMRASLEGIWHCGLEMCRQTIDRALECNMIDIRKRYLQ